MDINQNLKTSFPEFDDLEKLDTHKLILCDTDKTNTLREYYGNNIEIETIYGFNIIEFVNTNIYVIENFVDSEFCNDTIATIESTEKIKDHIRNGNNVECFYTCDEQLIKNKTNKYIFSTDPNEYEQLLDKIKNKKIYPPDKKKI
jgi:hypothetical protein